MHEWHEKIRLKSQYPLNIIVSLIEEGFSAHWHQEIEIVYILEGSMQIGLNNMTYDLIAGDIVLISSCDVHRYHSSPSGCKKIILQLGKSIFEPHADQIFGKRFKLPVVGACTLLDSSTQHHLHAALESYILRIYEEWQERSDGFELVIKATIYDLAAALFRFMPMVPYSVEEKTKRLEQLEKLDRVLSYIELHYDTEITLQSAATLSTFSVTYFSRFFKEATGANFVDYVNTYRVNMAMLALVNESQSVADIAYRCGFNSIETFNRVFKKVTGCTPTAYRSKK
jgi:AraC-like DNA-binding protein